MPQKTADLKVLENSHKNVLVEFLLDNSSSPIYRL